MTDIADVLHFRTQAGRTTTRQHNTASLTYPDSDLRLGSRSFLPSCMPPHLADITTNTPADLASRSVKHERDVARSVACLACSPTTSYRDSVPARAIRAARQRSGERPAGRHAQAVTGGSEVYKMRGKGRGGVCGEALVEKRPICAAFGWWARLWRSRQRGTYALQHCHRRERKSIG